MMQTATRIALLLGLTALLSVSAQAQTPTIGADGILNAGSFAVAGLPNAGIAQGSIFSIFGDNLGPAAGTQVDSFPLPTVPPGLAGSSVRVTVGGTAVNAIMLFTQKFQINAVLPSNTPAGTGTLTVTYNGATSNPSPITVLAGSFGTFTRNSQGSGPSWVQNFVSNTDQPFNSLIDSARPGQAVTLWGTGLGAVSGNEAGQPLPGNLANVNVRVLVGGREATLLYRGRSGCCVGVDQIVFNVPSGVSGCFVPVSVQVGNVVSNYTSMSVSPNGGSCSDPGGYTAADLERARANGGLRTGTVSLSKVQTRLNIPGLGNLDSKTDAGSAAFVRITLDNILNQGASSSVINPGACSVSVQRVGPGAAPPVSNIVGLNAGAALTVSGPNGSKPITATPNFVGTYSSILSNSIPFGANDPEYIVPGAHTITGPGGPDIGAFTASIPVPSGTTWANEASVSNITRANGQLVTWNGGDPNGFVYIVGASTNAGNTVSVSFLCFERTSAGQFTIPSAVLLALPPSATTAGIPTGVLSVGTFNLGTFTAPGLDYGVTTFLAAVGKLVGYQ